MVTTEHVFANPGVIGAKVSVASAIISFCTHGLPVVQFFAAILGGCAAIMSMIWIFVQMRRKR